MRGSFLQAIAISLTLTLTAVATVVTAAAVAAIPVEVRPYKVIVHQRTAEVLSSGAAVLAAGDHVLELANMTSDAQDPSRSNEMEENSLQVTLGEGMMAQRIVWQTVRRVAEDSPEVVALQQRLADVERQLRELDAEEALTKQHDAILLGLLQHIATQFVGNATESLDALFARRETILSASARRDVRRRSLQTEKAGVVSAQAAASAQHRVARVFVNVQTAGEVRIRTRHVIQRAHWQPSYDLHFDTKAGTVRVVYLALVHQHTSMPWERVQVELCTGKPSSDRTPPVLRPMRVSTGGRTPSARFARLSALSGENRAEGAPEALLREHDLDDTARGRLQQAAGGNPVPQAELYDPPEAAITSGISDVFRLFGTQTIHPRSDSRLRIAELVLPATFVYSTVPQLTGKVYLTAEFTNNSPYSLLPGAAMLFADSIFVGPSQLPVVGLANAVRVEVGVDRRMEAKRQLVRAAKRVETHLLSADIAVYDFEYRLHVQNNHDEEVVLRVTDALPTKSDPKAEYPVITVVSPSAGVASQQSKHLGVNVTISDDGIAQWSTLLKGSTSLDVPVQYRVEAREGYSFIGLPDVPSG